MGHAAAALILFSMFAGAVPGFWAAWVFCGLDFMYFLALVPCLFMTARKSKFKTGDISVRNVYEGETTTVDLHVFAEDKLNAVSLGCFRMDPSLKCEESALVMVDAGEMAKLTCKIQTKKRGAFEIPKVALILPEINGALRYAANVGDAESYARDGFCGRTRIPRGRFSARFASQGFCSLWQAIHEGI